MPPRLPLNLRTASQFVHGRHLTHTSTRRIPAACQSRSPLKACHCRTLPIRQTTSRRYTQPAIQPMQRDLEPTIPAERPPKRRRVSGDFVPQADSVDMTQAADAQVLPPRHEITLTPIEQTFRLLLLDVVEYIKEKKPEEGHDESAPQADLVLRFTGGWVRDKFLGVDSHDIDVGISTMTGYQFGLALKEYLDIPGNIDKYKEYHIHDPSKESIVSLHKIARNPEKSKNLETTTTTIFGLDVDFVNLRKETYNEDSRNPQVVFGTAEEDAVRRDATVNAMFYNLHTQEVENFTGRGFTDMEQKLIRTPLAPYQTFRDDPLRVLRLIRFASRLGYRIDPETEEAMAHEDIKTSLKIKISQERVGVEIEKTLHGPDPLTALKIIDRRGLFDTIFANHQDDAKVDTSSWSLAYNAVNVLLDPLYESSDFHSRNTLRRILIRDKNEQYYSWLLAALSPWITVPPALPTKKAKDVAPRVASVARESLRADNKTLAILKAASNHREMIWKFKNAYTNSEIEGTLPEIRQKIGLFIRTMSHEWRLCVVSALLVEIMQGAKLEQVFEEYEKFVLYIEKQGLADANLLRPLANGRELGAALGVKAGPWMMRALEMVIEWQLKNPDISDTDMAIAEVICENLLVAEAFLHSREETEKLEGRNDIEAARALIFWTADVVLPSKEFAGAWEEVQLADDDEKKALLSKFTVARLKSTVGTSVLHRLSSLLPITQLEESEGIIVASAAFTCENDPWTTQAAFESASSVLSTYKAFLHSKNGGLADLLTAILKDTVKPIFSRTKTPAITAAGRKNVLPVPQPKFDPSMFDAETKPWKTREVYVVTVLEWIIRQYQPSDQVLLEMHFPFLIPPILSLIDDSSLPYKALGANLLTTLLDPLARSKSTILQRTNLDSVFLEALEPCLLSLPTITSERESIYLLQAAYPAVLTVIHTRYGTSTSSSEESEKCIAALTRVLRHALIPSFHHTSNPTPTPGTVAGALSSFPYPRLSTLLLTHLSITITHHLSIHATKHIQEIIPLISSTLTNPFGTAYVPLLAAGVEVARALVLNAWPRLERWRGEVLGAICVCWMHVCEETEEQQDEEGERGFEELKKALKEVVEILRIVLGDGPGEEEGGGRRSVDVENELRELVEADERLAELLIVK
ncbi:hypothetical protein AJ80_02149 [Polytolypa hystricis UAMH7299]|uniref:Poly A polymerase head domain-containing protein n=1 Tax=Polytolypa hystricis (strain UAMH7299) TaxID=1447883 RepID=A0A2B7YRN5_POLH7|nr:hypothetical protein AJ80_02149 [Polytolypa hystricis UAMH7299]